MVLSYDQSLKHKRLRLFFEKGSIARIDANHQNKLRLILTDLDAAVTVEDRNAPAYNLHKLKGDRNNIHSVKVNGNWRVTFEFIDSNAKRELCITSVKSKN